MVSIVKRGRNYYIDVTVGRVHVVRGTLGTRDYAAAKRLQHRIEIALAEGPLSTQWPDLRTALPPKTFGRLVKFGRVKEKRVVTWPELRELFESQMKQQVIMNELSNATFQNYQRTLDQFELFLNEHHIEALQRIDKSVIEDFKSWKIYQIKKPNSGGGPSLHFDLVHLHHLFAFAIEKEFIEKNPVRVPGKRFDPSRGAQPFNSDELERLQDCAQGGPMTLFGTSSEDWLLFLLLRWTGFRCFDAVTLQWQEIDFDRKVIEHVCHKNRKKVILPIRREVLAVLDAERRRRNPKPSEPVLVNPITGRPLTRCILWQRVAKLGNRAGVQHAHPHRFRDTFAVDALLRCGNPYYVANLLGDTLEVVMRHYVPYVTELQERARFLMETGTGLEQYVTPASQLKHLSS
jgi:site-specific recombinase XerD